MQEDEPLSEDERILRRTLARLKPAAARLDLGTIRLEAQRRQSARQLRRWRGIAAALAAGLLLVLVLRTRPVAIQRIVYVHDSPVAGSSSPRPDVFASDDGTTMPTPLGEDYFSVRSRVLAYGVGVLRPNPPAEPHRMAGPVPTAAPLVDFDANSQRGS